MLGFKVVSAVEALVPTSFEMYVFVPEVEAIVPSPLFEL